MNLVPPVVGIKAGAGLGKTGAALEQIAAIPGIEQMNVEVFVPDHRLAEELAERAKACGAAPVGVLVIRGRGRERHGRRSHVREGRLAEQIGKAGLNVMGHLCRLNGRGRASLPKSANSPKHADIWPNFARIGPQSASCRTPPCSCAATRTMPDPDLIVVDEIFWRDAVSHKRLALDRLTEVGRWRVRPRSSKRFKHATEEERFAEAFAQVKARKEADDRKQDAEVFARRVRSAFEDGRDPRTVVTAEEAEIVAGVEWGSRGGPSITPGMELQGPGQRLARLAARRMRKGRPVLEPARSRASSTPIGPCSGSCWSATRQPRTATGATSCTCTTAAT